MTRACCAEGGGSNELTDHANGEDEIGPNVWRGLFLAHPLTAPLADLLPAVAPLQTPLCRILVEASRWKASQITHYAHGKTDCTAR